MKVLRFLFTAGCLLVIAALALDILRMLSGKEDALAD